MTPTFTPFAFSFARIRYALTLLLILSGYAALGPAPVYAQPSPPTNLELLSAPPPPPVAGVSASAGASTGNSAYCWWVIPTYPIGDGPPNQSPACLSNIAPLSASKPVTVSWPSTPSATNYRVLRTPTSVFPSVGGVCTACSVTTTSTTSFSDTGAAGSNYTPTAGSSVKYSLFLDNLTASTPVVRSQLGQTTYIAPQVSGTPTAGDCVQWGANGVLTDAGAACGSGGGGGNVTAGGTLTANAPVIGAGGTAVAVGTRTGNTTAFATSTGTLTANNCAKWDASGNIVDAGATCGSGSGNVTAAGTLTNNAPVIGQGGTATAVGTRSGNTTAFVTTTGAQTSGNCVSIDASGNHIANGAPCAAGTVTSIGTTGPITGGPITGTGNIACATCVTSSVTLTANAPVLGNGTTDTVVGTRTGNTTAFATSTGALTTNNCAKWDANGNIVDAGTTCGGGGSVTAAAPYVTIGGSLYGPVYAVTDPSTPTWSWVNQGTATITSTNGAQTITALANASVSLKVRTTTAPATPYTLIAMVRHTMPSQTFIRVGVGFRESATGKIKTIAYTSGTSIGVDNWTNATTFSSTNTSISWTLGAGVYFYKLTNDGTNISLGYSGDGVAYQTIVTEAKATFFTTAPDQLCFFVDTNNSNYPASITLLSWATS